MSEISARMEQYHLKGQWTPRDSTGALWIASCRLPGTRSRKTLPMQTRGTFSQYYDEIKRSLPVSTFLDVLRAVELVVFESNKNIVLNDNHIRTII